jgi:hypothetical protein
MKFSENSLVNSLVGFGGNMLGLSVLCFMCTENCRNVDRFENSTYQPRGAKTGAVNSLAMAGP